MTDHGHVAEASAANIFMVRDGVLTTPPGTDSILEGIVRRALLGIATDERVPWAIRSIDRTELFDASEIFLCGTGSEVVPVLRAGGVTVGDRRVGPFTEHLRQTYLGAAHGDIKRYQHWLTPVYPPEA